MALLDTLDGWTVHVPGHPDEAEALLRAAVTGEDRVYVRLSMQPNETPRPVDGTRFLTVRDSGGGPVVVAVGPVLDDVLTATEGLDATVLYATPCAPSTPPGSARRSATGPRRTSSSSSPTSRAPPRPPRTTPWRRWRTGCWGWARPARSCAATARSRSTWLPTAWTRAALRERITAFAGRGDGGR